MTMLENLGSSDCLLPCGECCLLILLVTWGCIMTLACPYLRCYDYIKIYGPEGLK